MNPSRSYHDDLIRDLKDPREACAYLNVAMREGDKDHFLVALRNVAESHGGLLQLSRRARLNRGHLYTMLRQGGNPEIKSINTLLNAWGLRLAIEIQHPAPRRRAA